MQISLHGMEFIKGYEKFRSAPYDNDGSGTPTIGWGSTYYEDGTRVTMRDCPISLQHADVLFSSAVNKVAKWITENVPCILNQNQFDAFCSLFYNIGTGNFQTHNPHSWRILMSCNLDAYADLILDFSHEKGHVSPGLLTRREDERKMFLTPC